MQDKTQLGTVLMPRQSVRLQDRLSHIESDLHDILDTHFEEAGQGLRGTDCLICLDPRKNVRATCWH